MTLNAWRSFALAAVLAMAATSSSSAGIPYAPLSTCRVTISQYPPRPACVTNFEPDVIRLCPSTAAPGFDTASIDVTVLDALGMRLPNASVRFYEVSGLVNLATGGSTTAVTDSDGKATIGLARGSGYGGVGVCADGVLICELAVRSPDVSNTSIASGCFLPTSGTSFVNSNDKTNTSCGFTIHFGPVTPGINNSWDLNCDNLVNSSDVGGHPAPGFGMSGGWLQHFGHGGALGAKSTCP